MPQVIAVITFWSIAMCFSIPGFSTPPLPQDALPGVINGNNSQPWAIPNREKENDPNPSNRVPQVLPSDSQTPVIIDKQEKPDFSEEQLRIPVKTIQLEGATLLPIKLIAPILKRYEGDNDLSFAEMQKLADELTQVYIRAGYLNSRIYLPPQDFQNGVLVLRAVEVTVQSITLENNKWFLPKAVLPQIGLKAGDFFNVKPLESGVRFVNDNPDLRLAAILEKGDQPGTTKVILKPQAHFPVHPTLFWDNLGRDSIGRSRFGISTVDNNFLGFGDTNTNSVNFTDTSTGVIDQYRLPIGHWGTQLGFDYSYSHLKVRGALKDLHIQSTSHIFSPSITQPLIRTERTGLTLNLAFDFKNLKTYVLEQPFYRDRLSILRSGFQGYHYDWHGRTLFDQEFAVGLPLFSGTVGNSSLASKAGSGTKFFRASGSVTRIQQLPKEVVGLVRVRYQLSPNRLIGAEQTQSGGAFSVRGYFEGQYLGDNGFSLSNEYYFPSYLIPRKWRLPGMKEPLRSAVRWVGFTDFGHVFVNHVNSSEARNKTLLSAGFGVRVSLTQRVVLRLDAGFPLLKPGNLESRPRLHFALQSTLF
ncbi:MAG: hypothetical protein K2X01_11800 [Cyanobacteria bacterium]|nr:hypothetical protein [Cyanobacteriota bacterium]